MNDKDPNDSAESLCLQQAANDSAKKVVKSCEGQFDAHKTDCNKFLKAVANELGIHDFKDGDDADAMIDFLEASPSGWTKLGTGKHSKAHEEADTGAFVVAGMKSTDMKKVNGHVSVITSGPMVASAGDKTDYPRGFWGQLGGEGKKCEGMNYSFPAERKTGLRYYRRDLP